MTQTAWLILGLVLAAGSPSDTSQPSSAAAGQPGAASRPAVNLGPLEGAWEGKDDSGQKVLRRFADGRMVRWSQGRTAVFRVVARDATEITLSVQGQRLSVKYELHGDELTLEQGPTRTTCHRLKDVPEEVLLRPLKLGPDKPLAAERLKQVQDELAKRMETDQGVRRKIMGPAGASRDDMKKMVTTDVDNTQYLRKLVGEVGWIDARRFGRPASLAAFLIVQHSGDLPLMLAALPQIEKDVKASSGAGQDFALLYDRSQLMQGKPQRYGSQVGQGNGKLLVLPLEDRKKVDEHRKSMGMTPLKDYLKLFGASMDDVEFLGPDAL